MRKVNCPECGKEIEVGAQAYKHAIHCLNIPDRGIEYVDRIFAKDDTEYGRRVRTMMSYAKERDE